MRYGFTAKWVACAALVLAAAALPLSAGSNPAPGQDKDADKGVGKASPEELSEWQDLYYRWALGDIDLDADANGNVVVDGVVLMPVPATPGDGTPGSVDVTLNAGQPFFLTLYDFIGFKYPDGSQDPRETRRFFKTLNLSLKIDGVEVINGNNVFQFYSDFNFTPPFVIDVFGDQAAWLQGISTLHGPLAPGHHIITLDALNTIPSGPGFPPTVEYHNTWNITVKAGQ